ncbi:MAG: sugar ABC transporter ATP-binding protein [Clostridia bacterium]|nr:sugar ABC transporter ATP-binding protein [Clostridia bacterium]
MDFTIRRGEIRGLIGENGSGKSTIMSIAAGMQSASSGEMLYMGKPWRPESMKDAQARGISMILQEANTIPHVTVAQNLFAGREEEFSRFGLVSMKRMIAAANARLEHFGIQNIRADMSIDALNFEDRKLIEIVRCVRENTEILVIDETTTALSLEGREILYRLIHRMTEQEDKAVVFVSHDMDEILEQCHVLSVLRDGEIIGELSRGEMDAEDAVNRIRYMMVGREIGEKYYREDYGPGAGGDIALELDNISFGPIRNFSLRLREGEILGFGGLSGCGMHEIGRAAFGAEKLESGRILRRGALIQNELAAIRNGIGYISKNRDTEALILSASITENIVLPSLPVLERFGFISPMKEKRLAGEQIEALRIKCGDGRQGVNTLSGGNKQKVSFAKWAATGSDVIIMDCPTRGVDIGVKQAMYALIEQMRHAGKAVIMISEELTELLGMADRLIIMKNYVVTKEFLRSKELRQTDVIEYMI